MGTKTSKTMYELAKAKSFEQGILKYRDYEQKVTYVGYLLPRKSVVKLFKLEGFNKDKTIERYIKDWADLGLVKLIGPHVFFYPTSSDGERYDDLILDRQDALSNVDAKDNMYLIGASA